MNKLLSSLLSGPSSSSPSEESSVATGAPASSPSSFSDWKKKKSATSWPYQQMNNDDSSDGDNANENNNHSNDVSCPSLCSSVSSSSSSTIVTAISSSSPMGASPSQSSFSFSLSTVGEQDDNDSFRIVTQLEEDNPDENEGSIKDLFQLKPEDSLDDIPIVQNTSSTTNDFNGDYSLSVLLPRKNTIAASLYPIDELLVQDDDESSSVENGDQDEVTIEIKEKETTSKEKELVGANISPRINICSVVNRMYGTNQDSSDSLTTSSSSDENDTDEDSREETSARELSTSSVDTSLPKMARRPKKVQKARKGKATTKKKSKIRPPTSKSETDEKQGANDENERTKLSLEAPPPPPPSTPTITRPVAPTKAVMQREKKSASSSGMESSANLRGKKQLQGSKQSKKVSKPSPSSLSAGSTNAPIVQSEKSNRGSRTNNVRSVTFYPRARIHRIPKRCHLTQELMNDIWYSADDFESFRQDCYDTLCVMISNDYIRENGESNINGNEEEEEESDPENEQDADSEGEGTRSSSVINTGNADHDNDGGDEGNHNMSSKPRNKIISRGRSTSLSEPSQSPSILFDDDGNEYCRRGLELRLNGNLEERQKRKKRVRTIVSAEQNFQAVTGMETDPVWLASLVHQHSRKCVQLALDAAARDAEEACLIHLESLEENYGKYRSMTGKRISLRPSKSSTN